ncbi:MAG: ABC transporter permease [Candidatus Bathyarchaeia archaeon]
MIEEAFLISLLAAGVRMTTPILFAALGEIFTERSGVMNLGLEGIMLMGALGTFAGIYHTGDIWFGILIGAIIAGFMSLPLAFMSVTLGINQVVVGLTITLLGTGLSSFLCRTIFGIFGVPPPIKGLDIIEVPILSQIPILGSILFKHNILVYLALILTFICGFILFKTTLGLKIRAVGENPQAADTLGINVHRIRYLCVIFGGLMAGLGGAYLTLDVKVFQDLMTGGRGWIALALVIFGDWNPYKTLIGALIFGCAIALQFKFQAVVMISPQIWTMVPYALTVIAFVGLGRKASTPAALGIPYRRGGE